MGNFAINEFDSSKGWLHRVVLFKGEVCQLQVQKSRKDGASDDLHLFDTDFKYKELLCSVRYADALHIHKRIDPSVIRTLHARVYKSGSDCTNGGISSSALDNVLHILDIDNSVGVPFYAEFLTQCLIFKYRNISMIGKYVHAEPVIFPGRHRMFGGNLLYSSDSRFVEMTGVRYPITIHDRME